MKNSLSPVMPHLVSDSLRQPVATLIAGFFGLTQVP
jgi:hypothetical protein